MAKAAAWVKRWSIVMSAKPVLPGVWKRKDGGHVVRARVKSPKSGRKVEILKVLADVDDPKHAFAWLTTERDRIRRGVTKATERPRFSAFAASLYEAKLNDRTIHSASGRKKWARVLAHLLDSEWAEYFVDQVAHADIIAWRERIAIAGWQRHVPAKGGERRLAASGDRYSPHTLNDWLGIARVIWKAATHRYELGRNPMEGVEDFPTDRHRTYTKEEPNALTLDEVALWLAVFKAKYPQFYAMVFLGLVLGHRPSMLRPLRRRGRSADLNFKTGRLLVRRSNTEKDEVEDFTKTAKDLEILLPKSLLDVLEWHIETQMTTWQMRESELLFPTADGGFRSRSCLDKPFAAVTAACGLEKRLTPRALRRTFQDISREAKVEGVVAKAISGHATDAMRILYSTAQDAEVQQGIARVVSIASAKPKRRKAG